jgi:hypothetical protein
MMAIEPTPENIYGNTTLDTKKAQDEVLKCVAIMAEAAMKADLTHAFTSACATVFMNQHLGNPSKERKIRIIDDLESMADALRESL